MLVAVFTLGLVLGAVARLIVVYLPRSGEEEAGRKPPGNATNRWLEAMPLLGTRVQAGYLAAEPSGFYGLLAIDIVVAVLVLLAYLATGLGISFAASAIFITVLVAVLFIDWQHHLIFPVLFYPAVVVAILSSLFGSGLSLGQALVGGAVGGALFLFMFWLAKAMYHKEALGFGDVQLAGFIGLILGYPKVMGALIMGSLIAGLAGLAAIGLGRKSRHDYIPFGTYLSAACLLLLVFQGQIWRLLPFQMLADLVGLVISIVRLLLQQL
ncbi:MAG: A24 family peptidase [Chloroflexi bacterium]|nr:A24 family peptidase [Chloroflexota bacterium]